MCSKFETRSYCVGGRHYSSTSNLDAYVTETAKGLIVGICTECFRKMIVDDKNFKAEG